MMSVPSCWLITAGCLMTVCGVAAAADGPAFTASDKPGEYRFDTGALRGTFRQEGKSVGLLPVEHVASGTVLTKWPGFLTYYRIFTTNRRYGESARVRPSEVKELPDGGLQMRWPATEEHPYVLTGTYRWRDAKTLDLDTVVEAKTELPDFEVFLSTYCSDKFPVTSVYVKQPREGDGPGFMTAEEADGTWQVFPRDDKACTVVKDGRWTIPPSPVDWAVMPDLAAPLVFRREPKTGVTVVLMAPPEDCFAVFTPRRDEAHYSMYLSFFGRTLQAGETARAHARLVVEDKIEDDEVVALYRDYVWEVKQRGRQ
jgi:hypothetical protein